MYSTCVLDNRKRRKALPGCFEVLLGGVVHSQMKLKIRADAESLAERNIRQCLPIENLYGFIRGRFGVRIPSDPQTTGRLFAQRHAYHDGEACPTRRLG